MPRAEKGEQERKARVAWSVERYPQYRAAISAFAWLPVFFLFFRETLSFREVLELEAIYYFTVVLFELPSGWFSDRFGRVRTLRLGAFSLLASYALFVSSTGLLTLAAAQVLLGVAMASQSGSDTAYHYDALCAIGESEQYAKREARAERAAFLMTAFSAFVGGALGLVSLRLPYLLALAGAAWAFALLLRFEPVQHVERAGGALRQLARVLRSLRDGELRWCFAFALSLYVLVHVPYEFYQPWLDALLIEGAQEGGVEWRESRRITAFLSGCVFAATSLLAAYVAGRSADWAERVGTRRSLVLALAFASLVCAGMGLTVHWGLALVLMLRSVPMAFARAPLRALVAPRVASSMRATWLSVEALAGRFVFGLALLGLARVARSGWGVSEAQAEQLRQLLAPLRLSALAGLCFVLVLGLLSRRSRSRADA